MSIRLPETANNSLCDRLVAATQRAALLSLRELGAQLDGWDHKAVCELSNEYDNPRFEFGNVTFGKNRISLPVPIFGTRTVSLRRSVTMGGPLEHNVFNRHLPVAQQLAQTVDCRDKRLDIELLGLKKTAPSRLKNFPTVQIFTAPVDEPPVMIAAYDTAYAQCQTAYDAEDPEIIGVVRDMYEEGALLHGTPQDGELAVQHIPVEVTRALATALQVVRSRTTEFIGGC